MMLPAHIARKLPDYLEIVQSGTAALVLKMPAANVQAFFDCHGWGATSAKKVFVKLVKSMGEERIYLKFTNAAHGRQWTDIRAFTNLLASFCDEESEKEKCALGAYEPQSLLQFRSCNMIFMHDMGVLVLSDKMDMDCKTFCREYLELMTKTEKLCTHGVVHGDIHCGNLMYKSTAKQVAH